jgi:hypothetical protein
MCRFLRRLPPERVTAFVMQASEKLTHKQSFWLAQHSGAMPVFLNQFRTASASRPRLQYRQLPTHPGDTRADQRLVADQPQGEADQDRGKSCAPRPPYRVPDGRGCYSSKPLRRHSAADRRTAATARSYQWCERPGCHAFLRKPRESYAAMKAELTLPARNAQASPLWRIADAICQGSVLQLVPVCTILCLNRPVIRWMSDYP